MQQQDIQATWIQMWKVIFPGKTLNNTGKIISSGHYEKQKLLKTVLERNQRVNWCWLDSFQSFSISVGHERWKETFDEYWLKCTFHWQTMQKDRVLKYLWWVFHGFALLMFMKVYDITWKSMMSHESLWCLTWKSMMPLETACSELALWLTSVTDVQCDHCVTCVPKSLTLAINFRSTGSEVAWKCLLKPIPMSKLCPMKLSSEKQLENHLRKEQNRAWVWKSPISLELFAHGGPFESHGAVVTVTTLLPFC